MKWIGLVVVAACGSSSSKTPDAHVADSHANVTVDAPPDAPPDTYLPDAAEPVAGHYHYVISKETWPTNTNESRADGFDLDNNGQVDNQLGQVMASLHGMGFDAQTPTDTALAQGRTITLADLGAADLASAGSASFTLYEGSDPNPAPCNGSADTTCGHHLHGSATFTISPSAPLETPLDGSITAGQLTAGPGRLDIGLTVFGQTPAMVQLLAAHVKLTPTAGGFMTGVIGGAISTDDRDNHIYPAMTAGLEQAIAHDCTALQDPPGCGCANSSQGAQVISLFDANHDCMITTDELKSNSLIMALFAPDVTINNVQALSVGFAVQAVDATFTP